MKIALCLILGFVLFSITPSLLAVEKTSSADGLWQGEIAFLPQQAELDIMVEVSGRPPVGTIDFPIMLLKFTPLENLKVEGSSASFEFDRQIDQPDPNDIFKFRGEVSPDGQTMTGKFAGRYSGLDLDLPFTLHRIGDAGSVRPPLTKRDVTTISDSGEELKAAFNRDRDKVRLVLLLSPTCDLCLASSYVVEKYVLDAVKNDRLAVYTIWGQMFDLDRKEDAERVTVRMPDSRVTHFWAAGQVIAQKFAQAAGLPKDETSWDTFQVFAPGQVWGDSLPAPARYMFINKTLPEGVALNGSTLADWIRGSLRGDPTSRP